MNLYENDRSKNNIDRDEELSTCSNLISMAVTDDPPPGTTIYLLCNKQ